MTGSDHGPREGDLQTRGLGGHDLQVALAGLGPFFAVDGHRPGEEPSAGWLRVSDLSADPDLLDRRVEQIRAALSASAPRPVPVERRVAVSVTHLGLVARLLSPTLAVAALGHPELAVADLWWQDVIGGAVPLSGAFVPAGAAVPRPVQDLTELVIDRFRLSRHVAWGNVASAANSAATVMVSGRPDLADAARRAADAVLADPRVEGGRLSSGPTFRRASCCLIYRLAGSREAVCGDCVLGG